MSTPAEHIARLDRSLARNGETIQLQRLTGTQGISFEVQPRARITGYRPEELIAGSGITQQDVKVILSPTQIERKGWPGAQPQAGDKRVPLKNDRIIRQGRPLTVQAGAGIYVDGTLVRIELQARGG
jgi:hypothetical protein